jgi:signal transduction histidine kinase/ActR/RegA family two-component response regulator
MNESEPSHLEAAAREAAELALQTTRDELAQVKAELESARAQAASTAAEREDFMAALSHELRTPLNPVLLIASEAAENTALPEAVRRDFATIARNAELEARLINDLLDLDRITRGKISLDKRSLDVRTPLEDAIGNIRDRLEAKEIELITMLAVRPHAAFGDAARLQQVFWTILKQAVKAAPAGEQIRIKSEIDDAARQIVLVFSTASSGSRSGFPRVDGPLKMAGSNGTKASPALAFRELGLGMTIARMLVEAHAGTIDVAGASADHGTVFTVRLPLAANASAFPIAAGSLSSAPVSSPPSETGPADAAAIRARILVVEDHEPTRVTLSRLLTRRHFAVIAAGSVEAALNAAASHEFDLVICDIALPDGDGYSLMTTLTERHGLVGIAVTGFGLPNDLERSEAAGFIAHVTKPVSMQALEAAFKNAQSSGAIKLA